MVEEMETGEPEWDVAKREILFDKWRRIYKHPRAKLDPKRLRVLKARESDGYTFDDLSLAIEGLQFSQFHMGEGERSDGTIYDEFALILRDAEHVDKFIRMAERGKKELERRARQLIKAEQPSQDWVAPTPEVMAHVREMIAKAKGRSKV